MTHGSPEADAAAQLAEMREVRDELLEELRTARVSIGWLNAELRVLSRSPSWHERARCWAASSLRAVLGLALA